VTIVTNKVYGLTIFYYPDRIVIYQPHKEEIMKALGHYFAGMFKGATSNSNIQSQWDIARRDASRFGPSHVAEIDAIFSRQS
jgi:hypothetical protein